MSHTFYILTRGDPRYGQKERMSPVPGTAPTSRLLVFCIFRGEGRRDVANDTWQHVGASMVVKQRKIVKL